jgi:hypothetical protein
MSNTNTGGPAFPGLHPSAECRHQDEGMTLRDYFAAKAMCGYLTGDALLKESDTAAEWVNKTAKASYEMADAMLSARGTEKAREV